eukprot:6596712-Prymnesium_polylepis.1
MRIAHTSPSRANRDFVRSVPSHQTASTARFGAIGGEQRVRIVLLWGRTVRGDGIGPCELRNTAPEARAQGPYRAIEAVQGREGRRRVSTRGCEGGR